MTGVLPVGKYQGLWILRKCALQVSFLNHVDEILHIWNGKQYDTIFYRAGSDNNPVQGFVIARCKKQVERGDRLSYSVDVPE